MVYFGYQSHCHKVFYIVWQMCLTVSFNCKSLSYCLDFVQIVPLWIQLLQNQVFILFVFSSKMRSWILSDELWCFFTPVVSVFLTCAISSSLGQVMTLICLWLVLSINTWSAWKDTGEYLGSVYTLWCCGNQNNIFIIIIVFIFWH